MSAGARTMCGATMLGVWRMAYSLGNTDERHAELHNCRFVGIFPKHVSQLFRLWYRVTVSLRLLAVYCVPLFGWTKIGHATDKQPQSGGCNLVPAINRDSASCCQDADQTVHVCEVLVAVAETNRLKCLPRLTSFSFFEVAKAGLPCSAGSRLSESFVEGGGTRVLPQAAKNYQNIAPSENSPSLSAPKLTCIDANGPTSQQI